jgi:hypothetical protein
LRGALGCQNAALLQLTPEERERCRNKLVGSGDGRDELMGRKLNLDKKGAFARDADAEPYLARKPKNGCKPRAAGDVDPMGKVGSAAGIACALSF